MQKQREKRLKIKNNLFQLGDQTKYMSKFLHLLDTLFERVQAGDMKEKQSAADRQQGLFSLCAASRKQKEIVYGG